MKEIKKWFEKAVPNPTAQNRWVQVGCHYEEFAEMATALNDSRLSLEVGFYGKLYKECDGVVDDLQNIDRAKKIELLDALCDQIVTAIGVAHMMGFDIIGALAEVNRSNYSKFENGEPVFNKHGKIAKGANYFAPNLEPFVPKE
nr:MAG TPA: NTP-PPase-like protein [Caudoviricetes sp.]